MIARASRLSLIPLFLIALVAVGFEVALTRYFAIASWAEYGYWVISIAMVGVCTSGVVLSLAPEWFRQRAPQVLALIPILLLLVLAGGFWWTTRVQFNPLELQNHALMTTQLLRIGEYYLALFPFFFLSGLFIGLYFVAFSDIIPKIYAADLIGAGLGGVFVLVLMAWLHPFYLPLALVPLIALAALFFIKTHRLYSVALAVSVVVCAVVLYQFIQPNYNEYKAISPPLKVEGSKLVEEVRSSRGVFAVLDNFTERLDIDISNNEQVLGGAQPIATFGLYGDGNRLTSLAKTKPESLAYLNAALDVLPYRLRPQARTLLVGTRGGFRLDEARQIGAKSIVALEPDPALHRFVLRYRKDLDAGAIQNVAPSAYLARATPQQIDIIDIASDFQSQSEANKYVFTVEAMEQALASLSPQGILSVPMSIREFTVYAVKATLTARDALFARGVRDPMAHIIVYRSAWNARILVSPTPFSRTDVQAVRAFADERSFDVSYFPGIDINQLKVWNDLPPTSFDDESAQRSETADDALAKEIFSALKEGKASSRAFDITPATQDRPFFNSVLRLTEIKAIFNRIQMVPREELGVLINVAVLIQAVVLAGLVLLLPIVKRTTFGARRSLAVRAMLYFAGLGLGFLMIQVFLIEKATALLNDRALSFALVLGVMLVSSGIGSYLTSKFESTPKRGVKFAWLGIVAWCVIAFTLFDRVAHAATGWETWAKVVLMMAWIAPISLALGFPFSLGLVSLRAIPAFVPWAWSLNGAFSVIATPLANLLAVNVGLKLLVIFGAMLYTLCFVSLPHTSHMSAGSVK